MLPLRSAYSDSRPQGPETLREISFAQTFGRDLQDARESCRRYRQYGEINDLNHAWDLYYQVRVAACS